MSSEIARDPNPAQRGPAAMDEFEARWAKQKAAAAVKMATKSLFDALERGWPSSAESIDSKKWRQANQLAAVNAALAAGAKVNSLSPKASLGSTARPLLRAAKYGSMEVVEALRLAGASLDGVGRDGSTILHVAIDRADDPVGLIRWALGHSVAIDALDEEGRTPLARALSTRRRSPQKRFEVAKVLLGAGASWDGLGLVKQHPLSLAIKELDAPAIAFMAAEGFDFKKFEQGRQSNGCFEQLLWSGSGPFGRLGDPERSCAVVEIAEILFAAGCRPQGDGLSPGDFLFKAIARQAPLAFLVWLRDLGAPLDGSDARLDGRQVGGPVGLAGGGNARDLAVAISLGMDPAWKSPSGASLLHAVCLSSHWPQTSQGVVDCLKLLVAGGADPNARGTAHNTPLFLAMTGPPQHQEAIVKALLDLGADPNKALPLPHGQGSVSPLGLLWHATAASDLCRSLGREQTRAKPQMRLVQLLLEAGADPNAMAGRAPALFAALLSGEGEAELLTRHGASLERVLDFIKEDASSRDLSSQWTLPAVKKWLRLGGKAGDLATAVLAGGERLGLGADGLAARPLAIEGTPVWHFLEAVQLAEESAASNPAARKGARL